MAKVQCVMKVYPEDVNKLAELKEALRVLKPVGMSELDVGFGIKLLKIAIIMDDSEGGDIEERVMKIPGVSQVEVESVDRL